eukprot:3468988-Amphidinium_carterae.1
METIKERCYPPFYPPFTTRSCCNQALGLGGRYIVGVLHSRWAAQLDMQLCMQNVHCARAFWHSKATAEDL